MAANVATTITMNVVDPDYPDSDEGIPVYVRFCRDASSFDVELSIDQTPIALDYAEAKALIDALQFAVRAEVKKTKRS